MALEYLFGFISIVSAIGCVIGAYIIYRILKSNAAKLT